MPRKNDVGVVENAEFNIDQKVYTEEHVRIFGEGKKQFCDTCEKRLSYCECPKEEKSE